MWKWRNNLVWAAMVAGAFGCGGGNNIPATQQIQQDLALTNFNSCQDLQSYIQDTAVLDMKSQLEAQRRGYGYYGYPGGVFNGVDDSGGVRAGAAAPGPTAVTTTNVQVAGVDEADFVKNDGTRIFVLSSDKLYAASSWPADQTTLQSKLQIEGWPREMFLDENNHLVVFSTLWGQVDFDNAGAGIDCGVYDWYCGYWWANTTKVTVLDVTDISNLKVVSQTYLPGYYDDSRRIGSSVRLVLGDNFRWPDGVKWYPDYTPDLYNNAEALAIAYAQLEAANEKVIRSTTYDQWLPPAHRRLDDGSLVTVPYNCAQFSRSNAPHKLGMLTVATLDLNNPSSIDQSTIMADVGQVYASTSALYVAVPHWWWWYQPGEQDYTYLYKFDLTNPDHAAFLAAGGVPGTIIDQYSMDETNGAFRVATAISTRVPSTEPNNWWGDIVYTNQVSVLQQSGNRLKISGSVGNITPGEQLHSSRFIGNQGFITTSKQMDPLLTFDLSDPTHPVQVGQLQVPGWSSYLHPIDATHLLSIGENVTQDPVNGEQESVQLILFDVSDLANPKNVATTEVGSGWAWSDANWDHKAFNYFPETGLLAIPFYDWFPCNGACVASSDYWDNFVSDLRVFKVDTTHGFTSQGAVSMKDVYEYFNDPDWQWYWAPDVRRSVMATDANGNVFVYAISDAGIRVSQLGSMGTPLKTVSFDIAYTYP